MNNRQRRVLILPVFGIRLAQLLLFDQHSFDLGAQNIGAVCARMRPHLLCMFVLFGAWWAIAIEMMLYPIITHYDFRGNDKYINSSIVVIGANPLNKSFILEFFVLRTIRDAKIVLTLSVRAFDGVGKTALFTRFVDGCEFIRRPSSDRLIKAFYEQITKHSRIKRCPYYPGDSIMINVTPYSLAMPSFVPEADCFFDVKTFTNARTELIFETHWHSTMTRRENVRKVLSKAHNMKTR